MLKTGLHFYLIDNLLIVTLQLHTFVNVCLPDYLICFSGCCDDNKKYPYSIYIHVHEC